MHQYVNEYCRSGQRIFGESWFIISLGRSVVSQVSVFWLHFITLINEEISTKQNKTNTKTDLLKCRSLLKIITYILWKHSWIKKTTPLVFIWNRIISKHVFTNISMCLCALVYVCVCCVYVCLCVCMCACVSACLCVCQTWCTVTTSGWFSLRTREAGFSSGGWIPWLRWLYCLSQSTERNIEQLANKLESRDSFGHQLFLIGQ
jgi:hypothetical protein